MTATKVTGASSACTTQWEELKWSTMEKQVIRLQVRIAKATREGKKGKVKALQRILTHSFYAKCLAVKRVVHNKGANTPGVDGVLWCTNCQRMKAVTSLRNKGYNPLPLRRIHIPKKNPNRGKRPLSIPCMKDRAMQALWQMAIAPIAEVWADPNSYGFRPKRSVADAIEQTFIALSRGHSPQWIFEGDIKACFDKLSQDWLLGNMPMNKCILSKFLKAGFVEKKKIYPTEQGAPQGGTISPTLTLMALSGLERLIKENFKKKDKVNVIVYCDDFIITCTSKERIEQEIIPLVEDFLNQRGLEISQEKSSITHVGTGFDFLGHNIRKYGKKLMIKPSKANIRNFLQDIKKTIKSNGALKMDSFVHLLNQKILGWAYFFRHVVSSQIFSYVDQEIYWALERWMWKRHPSKGKTWITNKYFRQKGLKKWQFYTQVKKGDKKTFLDLASAEDIKIRRHIKIKGIAHPFDPEFRKYFEMRDRCKLRMP